MSLNENIKELQDIVSSLENKAVGGYNKGYAEGEAIGFDKGVAEVKAENAVILTDCNIALTEKGVSTAETLADVPVQIGNIKAEPMWLPYITSCQAMFRGATFPENTELVMQLPLITYTYGFQDTFRDTKTVTSVKLIAPGDNAYRVSCQSIFQGSNVRIVDLTEFDAVSYNWTNAFYMASFLEEIIGELKYTKLYDQNFDNAFYNCGKLREVRFAKGVIWKAFRIDQSHLLSDDSIQSIIDGLFDLTGATAQTLTFHKDVGAKLTDAQKATITAKNWTLVY